MSTAAAAEEPATTVPESADQARVRVNIHSSESDDLVMTAAQGVHDISTQQQTVTHTWAWLELGWPTQDYLAWDCKNVEVQV